jgi:hypothetical protein
MRKTLVNLHLKRGQLVERIAQQRATLAREAAPLKAACDTADWLLATVRDTLRQASQLVQRHPAATAGLVAALIALKPRRVVRWLGRTLLVWRSWRSLRQWLPRW